ncbi:DUF2057 family protein [Motilimonas cestriensis]|uniref:DUF2057 family protein n=1 Tax=Motilimonas cestriensis TaxID=2742685 RepID=UPI003DA22794
MTLRFFTYLVCLLSSTGVFAGSQIQIPSMFKLLYHNGEKTQLTFYNKAPLQLSAGRQQLVLQYQQAFDGEADSAFISVPIVLYFFAKPEQQLRILASKPRTVEEARSFAQTPEFSLVDMIKGTEIAFDTILTPRFGWQNGPNIALLDEIKKGQQQPDQQRILNQLKLLYQSANTEKQTHFIQWLKQDNQISKEVP